MFCVGCGTELPEGAAFCPLCGSRAAEGEEAVPAAPQPPGSRAGARTRPDYPEFQKKGRGWMVVFIVGVVLVTLAGASAALAIFALSPRLNGGHSEVLGVDTSTPVQTPLLTTPTPIPVPGCRELAAGCEAVVANVGEVGLRLRESPGTGAPSNETLRNGAKVCVIGSSAQADGITWWRVRVPRPTGTVEGWSAEGDPNTGEGPYLTATNEPC
jgi:hypothetical protein